MLEIQLFGIRWSVEMKKEGYLCPSCYGMWDSMQASIWSIKHRGMNVSGSTKVLNH